MSNSTPLPVAPVVPKSHVAVSLSDLAAQLPSLPFVSMTTNDPKVTQSNHFENLRQVYFKELADGNIPPVVLVFGQSSSGKSSAISMLESHGFKSVDRLITRPLRESDGSFEVVWKPDQLPVTTDSSNSAKTPPADVLFAIYNYGNYYANPAGSLQRLISQRGSPGVGILMGKLLDLPNVEEALSNILPGLPVLPVRLDVQPSVLAGRLSARKESCTGEQSQRLIKLAGKYIEDQMQLAAYVEMYGLRQLPNLLPDEAIRFGVMHASPLIPETLPKVLAPDLKRVKEHSTRIAKDILSVRTMTFGCGHVPESILHTMQDVLMPQLKALGIPAYLKGGVAVAAYLGNLSRRVSMDVDFTVPCDPTLLPKLMELHMNIENVHGRVADKDWVPEGNFQERWAVSNYRSILRKGIMLHEGHKVELDEIVITRLQPENRGFCYEFICDHGDRMSARTVQLPNGDRMQLLPPEHLLLEKLIAGRGAEMKKFDFFDSAGLLATQIIDPNMVHKLVFQQAYNPKIDYDVAQLVEKLPGGLLTVKQFVAQLGIEAPGRLVEINGNRLVDPGKAHSSIDDNISTAPLSLTALKHLMMLGRLEHSISRIEAGLDETYQIYFGQSRSIKEMHGEAVLLHLHSFRRLLEAYATYEVGRGDIFVRRQSTSAAQIDQFFQRLERGPSEAVA